MDEYQKAMLAEPKLIKPKLEKERKSINQDVQNSVKKLKIQSDKENKSESGETAEKTEVKNSKKSKKKQDQPQDENQEKLDLNEDGKINDKQEIEAQAKNKTKELKESKPPKETKEQQQMRNQHNLFQFFQQKKEKPKEDIKKPVVQFQSVNIAQFINKKQAFTPITLFDTLKQQNQQLLQKQIFYFFHDSLYQTKQKKVSYIVTSLKPFERDFQINYEADSDEEIELLEAEDCENISENEEESDIEETYDDFIVPDGHLSEGENSQNEVNLKNVQQTNKFQTQLYFFDFRNYELGRDKNMDDQIVKYQIINISEQEYPIKPFKEKISQEAEIKQKDIDIFEDIENVRQFIQTVHGTYQTRIQIVDTVSILFPKYPKIKIEKKLRQVAKKVKLELDKRVNKVYQERFYINQEFLEEKQFSQLDALQLVLDRRQEFIQKQKDHKLLVKQMQENERLQTNIIQQPMEMELISSNSENSNNKQRFLEDFLTKKN